jgi:hypothetical protein
MKYKNQVGITAQVDFEYNNLLQKQKVRLLIKTDSYLNQELSKLIKDRCFWLFNKLLTALPVSFDDYELIIESSLGDEFEQLLDWVSIYIDVFTAEDNFDKICNFLEGNSYQDELIDLLKTTIIAYLNDLKLGDNFKVNVAVESIGYGPQ